MWPSLEMSLARITILLLPLLLGFRPYMTRTVSSRLSSASSSRSLRSCSTVGAAPRSVQAAQREGNGLGGDNFGLCKRCVVCVCPSSSPRSSTRHRRSHLRRSHQTLRRRLRRLLHIAAFLPLQDSEELASCVAFTQRANDICNFETSMRCGKEALSQKMSTNRNTIN